MPPERRIPTQQRSREKYDLILGSAKTLIGERGNDSVSMREIAKHAGLAISSIYQYFPDKNAILAAIMQSYFDNIRGLIKVFLQHCQSLEDFRQGLQSGMDMFYSLFQQEPALATLWAGIQANNELKALDAEDSRENARLITDALTSTFSIHDEDELFHAILLLLHTAGMTVRLALSVPENDANRLVEEFKTLARLRLDSVFAGAQGEQDRP